MEKTKGGPTQEEDPVAAVLGERGWRAVPADLFRLSRQMCPNLQIMPRKSYVGLGTPKHQYLPWPRGQNPSVTLLYPWGWSRRTRPWRPLPEAPRLGGSDRFKLLLEISTDADIENRSGPIFARLRQASAFTDKRRFGEMLDVRPIPIRHPPSPAEPVTDRLEAARAGRNAVRPGRRAAGRPPLTRSRAGRSRLPQMGVARRRAGRVV